jgi:hypothetical protein
MESMKQVVDNNPVVMEKLTIQLRTLKNGYGLDVNDEGYQYFDVPSLVEGFFIHVAMERVGEMTKEEMTQMLSAIKDGTAARKLQEEVNALKAKNDILSKKLRSMKKEMKKFNNEKYY